jgi:flagellar hook-associated protein 2
MNPLTKKETSDQTKISAYGSLSSALDSFKQVTDQMTTLTDLANKKVTSSDTAVVIGTANGNAVSGTYSVIVNAIAMANQVTTGPYPALTSILGTGTLNITKGGVTSSITIDATNNTLVGIRDAINNAKDNPGVTASTVTTDLGTKLVLTSNSTGANSTISVSVTNDGDGNNTDNTGLSQLRTANLIQTQPAQSASIKINGDTITSASNTIDTAISGVTLNLLKADPNVTKTVTISNDGTTLGATITGFVAAYNSLSTVVGNLGKNDVTTHTTGDLYADSLLDNIRNKLSQLLSTEVSSNPKGFTNLASIGITRDENGVLKVDQTKLSTAINTNFQAVANLFATSNTGIANQLSNYVSQLTDSANGLITTKVSSLNSDISRIDTEKLSVQNYLDNYEARLRAQYAALDNLISRLQQTGSFITAQSSTLSGSIFSKSK